MNSKYAVEESVLDVGLLCSIEGEEDRVRRHDRQKLSRVILRSDREYAIESSNCDRINPS